jgi:hypothetical protein
MAVGILPTYPTNNSGGGGGGGGSVTGSLNDLSDVVISTPGIGQVLAYGAGSTWRNTNLTAIPAFTGLQNQVNNISGSIDNSLNVIQGQVNNISANFANYTPLTTTSALSANLFATTLATSANLSILITNEANTRYGSDQNLQRQINEIVAGTHVVFREQFTGDGISKQFQLNGAVTNGQFISGGWQAVNVLNTLESNVTDLNGKPIYDASWVYAFTRHRIYVDNVTHAGLVTLDYVPISGQSLNIWYWYDMQGDDRVNNYYRDDFVAKMEENSGDLSTNINVNTVNFNGILSNVDNTVQKALDTIDDHLHNQYTLLTTTNALTGRIESEIASVSAAARLAKHLGLFSTSTGLSRGGNVVQQSATTFAISSGSGVILDFSTLDIDTNPTYRVVNWNNITNISISGYYALNYPFVYVGISSGGNSYIQPRDWTEKERRDNILLGKVMFRTGTISVIRELKYYPQDIYANIVDINDAIGTLNLFGNVYSASGANLTIKKSSGCSYRFGSNTFIDVKTPSTTDDPELRPVTFNYVYRKAGGSTALYIASQVNIDPSKYDNGSGVLQSVPSKDWTIQRIYFYPQTNSTYIFYGQLNYASLSLAKDGILSETFTVPDDIMNGASFRGWLLVKQGTTNLLNSSDAVFVNANKFGAIAGGGAGLPDHNSLSGLQGGESNEFYHLSASQYNNYIGKSEVVNISASLLSQIASVSGTLDNLLAKTGEPQGFENRTDSFMHFNDATRTFSISGSYYIWQNGVRYLKSGETQQIPNTVGNHYFYYNSSSVFTYATNPFNILADVPISVVYWDGNRGILLEERHGIIMDRVTHEYLHATQGTQYESGLAINSYTPATDSVLGISYGVGAGTIADEDIKFSTTSLLSGGPYTILYRQGVAGTYTISSSNSLPFLFSGGNILYNQLNGSNWQLTQLTSNPQYVNYYLFATTAVSSQYQIFAIPGQSTYTSPAAALAESITNLNLSVLPFNEFSNIYKVTYERRNTYGTPNGHAVINSVTRLINNNVSISNVIAATNHNSLSGLQGGTASEYYHLTAAQSIDFIGESSVRAISGNLYSLIQTTSGSSVASNAISSINGLTARSLIISGVGSVSVFNVGTNVIVISGGASVGGSGISDAPSDGNIYGRSNASWVPISSGGVASTNLYGRLICTSASDYTINHANIDATLYFPVVSLEMPDENSDIFSLGIFNRTSTSFRVVLSGTPGISSHYILWHIVR